MYVYINIYINSCLHNHMHTCIHACIHAYIHTEFSQAWPLRGVPTVVKVLEGRVCVITVQVESLMNLGMNNIEHLEDFLKSEHGMEAKQKLLADSPSFVLTPMSTMWIPFGHPSQPANQVCRQWGSRQPA